MYFLVVLIECDASQGYYNRGYESRNLIEREHVDENEGVLVVSGVRRDRSLDAQQRGVRNSERPIRNASEAPTRTTSVVIAQICFRGPGEQCTKNRDFDIFGQRCAAGYYCNKHLGVCQGLDYVIDSKVQYILNPNYTKRLEIASRAYTDGL